MVVTTFVRVVVTTEREEREMYELTIGWVTRQNVTSDWTVLNAELADVIAWAYRIAEIDGDAAVIEVEIAVSGPHPNPPVCAWVTRPGWKPGRLPVARVPSPLFREDELWLLDEHPEIGHLVEQLTGETPMPRVTGVRRAP